jgi:mitogen-activated protein kinase kinase 3
MIHLFLYRNGSCFNCTIAFSFLLLLFLISLANMVHQLGPLEENVLAHISYQIVSALAYLRKYLKRVHRDIKPSNVLINSNGLVKLSDFGLSAELQNSIAMCATFVGTFKYMSPERIKNDNYGQPADIWSLGITMLECATGCYPYQETGTYIEMVQTVLESPVPSLPPNTKDKVFSNELREFTASCVHKNPKQRVPADILLGSPWFRQRGATSLDVSVNHLKSWISR